jgi:hypothetical protein
VAAGSPAGETYPDAQRRKEIALANERELRVAVMREALFLGHGLHFLVNVAFEPRYTVCLI